MVFYNYSELVLVPNKGIFMYSGTFQYDHLDKSDHLEEKTTFWPSNVRSLMFKSPCQSDHLGLTTSSPPQKRSDYKGSIVSSLSCKG